MPELSDPELKSKKSECSKGSRAARDWTREQMTSLSLVSLPFPCLEHGLEACSASANYINLLPAFEVTRFAGSCSQRTVGCCYPWYWI